MPNVTPPIKLGDRGPAVRDLQSRLINKGFRCGPAGADGDFGPNTDAAVRRYQLRCGLHVDGVVGPLTWAALTRRTAGSASLMADAAHRLVTAAARPRYVFGAEVALTDPGPSQIDCSELVQWAVYQVTKRDWVDGSANQYAQGEHCSIDEAIRTKGALLFLSNGGPLGIHHVEISMGNGTTAGARSSALGCGEWPATGRGWTHAARVPVLHY
ncbi:MAG: hypothetical protein JWM93_2023 [Frankiales bacterium]|nr:hypothetical protein [Frankiales bacterium]